MAWTVGSVYVLCIDKEFYYVLGMGGTFYAVLDIRTEHSKGYFIRILLITW